MESNNSNGEIYHIGTCFSTFLRGSNHGVVSVRNNRKYIGIELEREYFNLTKKRIESERNKLKLDV